MAKKLLKMNKFRLRASRKPLIKKTNKKIKSKKGPVIRDIKRKVKRPARVKNTANIDSTIHRTKIRVIGIGGGGGTIVSEIANRVKKADFYVANTDSSALNRLAKRTRKFHFGQNLTRGLGTGMNVELGEEAAHTEEEKIKKILEGQDLCIFIASLGGGTSSGAAPVFAKISRSLGNITYGIFTLPFKFEGERKMEMALSALERIKPNLNVYTVIPNERIFQIIDKNTPLRDALSAINKRLADNLEGLIEMIYLAGLINIDFADLRTILSGRGRLAYLNTVESEASAREEAIKKLISSPLYPYGIKGSKGILYNITSGKNIQLSEVSQISNVISSSVSRSAKIIFGINQNSKYQNRTKITLLAAGCGVKGFLPLFRNKKLKEKAPLIPEIPKIVRKRPHVRKKTIPKPFVSAKKPKKKKPKPKPVLKKPVPAVVPQKPAIITESSIKVRKNALQVRREAEEAEKEILDQEKIWEIPAILRRKE